MDLEGGIKAARQVFGRVYINTGSTGAARLVECLKRYRRNVSAKTGESGSPLHDEYSHGADAWRQFAQGYKAPSMRSDDDRRSRRERNHRTA